jgi:hypothetical protein
MDFFFTVYGMGVMALSAIGLLGYYLYLHNRRDERD